jgi:hypothetical protein
MGAGSIVNTNGDSNIGELDNMVSVTFFFGKKHKRNEISGITQIV